MNYAQLFQLEISLRALFSSKPLRWVVQRPVDIFLCLVDHYEPQVGRPTQDLARARVEDWVQRYPAIAGKHRDAEGLPPRHSFFYPVDEYDEWEFAQISQLCRDGWGELEIHLHHWDDTSDGLREKLRRAKKLWNEQGMLCRWPDGRNAFGFIHGNWALDNSRCSESPNPCGVNDELSILMEEGCYADFTFPAWGCSAQPRMMNTIYYARDNPDQPKSYDTGERIRVLQKDYLTRRHEDTKANEDILTQGRKDAKAQSYLESKRLLMIPGVLAPFIDKSMGHTRIAMDDSDIAVYRGYNHDRMDRWVRAGISVKGKYDRFFIKLHSHGTIDVNRESMLGVDLEALFADAEARYNDDVHYRLHYVTAREMFNVIKATEAGAIGSIAELKEWCVRKED